MKKPTYSTSDGQRYNTEQINRKSDAAAKQKLQEQLDEFGYNFCTECLSNECKPLDVSHTISRKWAKENGQAEFCWMKENMTILGRNCHQEKDKLNLQFQSIQNRDNGIQRAIDSANEKAPSTPHRKKRNIKDRNYERKSKINFRSI